MKTTFWLFSLLSMVTFCNHVNTSFVHRHKKALLYSVLVPSGIVLAYILLKKIKKNNDQNDQDDDNQSTTSIRSNSMITDTDNEEEKGIENEIDLAKHSFINNQIEQQQQQQFSTENFEKREKPTINNLSNNSASNDNLIQKQQPFSIENLEMIWEPIIKEWDITYISQSSKRKVNWNPLLLVLRAYWYFDLFTYQNNQLLLFMLTHIAKGKDAKMDFFNQNEDITDETLSKQVSEIEGELQEYGKYFFLELFKRADKITIKEYSAEKQKLFLEVMKLIEKNPKEKLFMKNREAMEKKGSHDPERQLAELAINNLPVMCHKYPRCFKPNGIASTDSQGSFVPLVPVQTIATFVNSTLQKIMFINANCGDNVDSFLKKTCEGSNIFNFFAHAVVTASQKKLSELFNTNTQMIALGKRLVLLIAPGNHDIGHTPAGLGNFSRDWKKIKDTLIQYHLFSEKEEESLRISLQNYYFLHNIILPKTHYLFITKTSNRKKIRTVIHAQHSVFSEPIYLEDRGEKIHEGSWLTWGKRIKEKKDLENIICEAQKKFPGVQNILNFCVLCIDSLKSSGETIDINSIQKKIIDNLFYIVDKVNIDSKRANGYFITIIQTSTPTLWCDFSFKTIIPTDKADRGGLINTIIVSFLSYLFLTMNAYEFCSGFPNVIQFFGHSHDDDQEATRLINYLLQSPPYHLNTIFLNAIYRQGHNSIIDYTMMAISYYHNIQQQNMFLYKGIINYFLPISPITKHFGDVTHYIHYMEDFLSVVQPENKFSNCKYEPTLAVALELPYFLIFTTKHAHYISAKELHDMTPQNLFIINKKPLPIEGSTLDKNIEAADPQQEYPVKKQ